MISKLQQIAIDPGLYGVAVPDRRHTTNPEARRLANELGSGLFDLLPNQLGHTLLTHPIRSAGNHDTALPDCAVRKTIDFAICATEHPIAWAASFAVLVVAGIFLTCASTPTLRKYS